MKLDVIVDLLYGDSGKGKVSHHLLGEKKYTHCLRYNGGQNAGHTIIHNGNKFITHGIPAGVFHGVKSIIGPGCVFNVEGLMEEIKYLNANGVNVNSDILKIAYNTHVITESHLKEDGLDKDIGTTKRGNGPAYRDKYSRKGKRAEDFPELKEYLVDLYEEFFVWHGHDQTVLAEGAQGYYLDIDHGDYPYVTSSHCTVAGALLNGFPHNSVRDVYGVAKAYETYVGAKKFQPDDEIFNKLREVGKEYGATTGRPRQTNWLNIDKLKKAIEVNGVNKLIFNKMDILKELNEWKIISRGKIVDLENEVGFKDFIYAKLYFVETILFSYRPDFIGV